VNWGSTGVCTPFSAVSFYCFASISHDKFRIERDTEEKCII
jgi:hypothetical protein